MSLEQKQQFLYTEIIDNDYSPEEFQSFLETANPKAGLNLDLWTMAELRKTVAQFRSKYKPVNAKAAEVTTKQVEKVTVVDKATDKQVNVVVDKLAVKPLVVDKLALDGDIDNIDPISGTDIYIKTINCLKVEPVDSFDRFLTVMIRKFEKAQAGLFQQDYVNYCVETPERGWSVMRRYNQFVWLRQNLQRMYPGLPIPPIPKKGAFRNFEEAHLHRRMNALENFLNKILYIPQLKLTAIVIGFLKLSDPVEFMKLKKDFTFQEVKMVNISKLRSQSGTVKLAIDAKIPKLFNVFRQTYAFAEPRVGKIYRESKALQANLEQSAKIVQGMSVTFNELADQHVRFLKNSEIVIDKPGFQLYRTISNLTRDLSKSMMEEAVAFKQYMYGIYKFEMHHLNTMNDMLKKVDELREEYEQYKAKLKRNKEKLFTEKNYSKWGLNTAQLERLNQSKGNQTKEECIAMMLPQETEMQMNMRDQYALMNAALYLEMIRYTKDNPHYLTRAILELSKKQAAASSAKMMLWADIQTVCGNQLSPTKSASSGKIDVQAVQAGTAVQGQMPRAPLPP